MVITTTIAKKLHSEWTAEGRAQALHEMYLLVYARHQHFLKELLPMLETPYREEDTFKNIGMTTRLIAGYGHPLDSLISISILTLSSEGTRKDNIMSEVSRSGMYRWSPIYKRQESLEIMKRLKRADLETWVCLFPLTAVRE